MQIERLRFDLRRLVEDVVRLLGPRAREKRLDVAMRYAPDAPTGFVGDPGRIRQVLVNLLGNAIKFTHEGSVAIIVECGERVAGRARMTVTVEDTGIGVRPEHIDRIFEEFTQADVSTTRVYGGTGLGLSISKGLVTLMGGEIGVRSSPGVGSSFWFALGLETGDEPAREEGALPGDEDVRDTGRYGLRVLVVDDNAVNRLVAQRLLECLGCSVVTAESGRESLEVLRGTSCDLVFMDCRMPGMDGFQATAAIRELEAESGRRVPVVAVTANALEGDRESCLEGGMDDYVAKPIGMADLRAVLERWAPGRPVSEVLVHPSGMNDE
jgi:CheY-like chemotaxis protein